MTLGNVQSSTIIPSVSAHVCVLYLVNELGVTNKKTQPEAVLVPPLSIPFPSHPVDFQVASTPSD